MKWFVSNRGERIGPLSTADVLGKLIAGDFDDGALVWRDGLGDWQPLIVHFKRPPFDRPTNPLDLQSVTGASESVRRSFIARFWRGQVRLPTSFWVVGVIGTIAIAFIFGLSLTLGLKEQDFDPYIIVSYLGGYWIAASCWSLFLAVGVWRSAQAYRREKRRQAKSPAWATVAQVTLVVMVVALIIGLFRTGSKQLAEAWQIAFQNDPAIPEYTLRVMRNGTELEIAGGIKYGLAREVATLIKASPRLEVIHLNSEGGRTGEAETLGRLIRDRRLSTYTSSQCLSACTIAFAAGRERWLKSQASLGYHAGKFAGQEQPERTREALLRAGVPSAIAERATSHSSTQMWYPTEQELLTARVVTGIADACMFAASGYGLRPDSSDFSRRLRQSSLFQAFDEVAPKAFASLVSKFQNAYLAGVPECRILDDLRTSEFVPVLHARLATTTDQLLRDYATLMADQYEWLLAADPGGCYEYAIKGATTTLVNSLPAPMRRRELALNEQVLRAPSTAKTINAAQLTAAYASVFVKLAARHSTSDLNLLDAPEQVEPPQYRRYCDVMANMLREISRLPLTDAAVVMRDMFKR
jgi:hypothetical protein